MPEPNPGPVVVTGAAGFIGRALVERLAHNVRPVIAVTRGEAALAPGIAVSALGDLSAATDWAPVLSGAGALIHLASRAHVAIATDDLIEREAKAAAHLARAALAAGIGHIILVSSIKVMGEWTGAKPFRADQAPAPEDAYGRLKWRLEEAMRREAPALTVIRPPLVYGPAVKANFRSLIRLIDSGLPLPLAGIANRRSFIFLDNLLDLLEIALDHAEAPGQVFLARDDEEISTPELLVHIGAALDRRVRLFRCPPALLRLAARAARQSETADRLLGSLQIDDHATRARLHWRPRATLREGIAATCRWYRETSSAAGGARR